LNASELEIKLRAQRAMAFRILAFIYNIPDTILPFLVTKRD